MSFNPDAIRAFEHAGWEKAAAEYGATFARASGEFVGALLDAAQVGPGMHVLDLCCGSGLVALAAARRGAPASGLDFSPKMLELARAAGTSLCFFEGDAEQMPFGDAEYQAVVSNFGIHHVPRPRRAAAEAFRVLRPGGWFAVTTWAVPAENIAWKLLFDAIHLHGDPSAAKTPPSGGNLGEADAVSRLLEDAGFAAVGVEMVRREWRLGEPRDLLVSLRRGTARTAALIDAQPASSLPAIEIEIAKGAAPYRDRDGYAIPIVAILGRGVKPA
jgi:SAM-dependent methyltransferase